MAVEIPQRGRQILEKPSIGNIATLMGDGSPHVTPVWVDAEGDVIVVNTLDDRLKARNVRRDPRGGHLVPDPDNPGVALIARGTAEVSGEGAKEHADRLSKKYLGEDVYPYHQPGDVRVLIRVHPERVFIYGA